MRNRQEKQAKDRERRVQDKIENFFQEREFIDQEGNRFVVTAQGWFYCPKASGEKKHPCPDCYFCQRCSDSRCTLCQRVPASCPTRKESSD